MHVFVTFSVLQCTQAPLGSPYNLIFREHLNGVPMVFLNVKSLHTKLEKRSPKIAIERLPEY